MNAEQTTGRVWNRRRTEKNSGGWPKRRLPAKSSPLTNWSAYWKNLLAPGDRVVLEGNNQKQADFLSRMLAEVNPQKNPRPCI